MTQLVVHNLESDVRDRLRDLAATHGHSVEDEIRDILRRAVMSKRSSTANLGSRLAQRFSGRDLIDDIDELRRQTIQAPSFDDS
jgi:plasmid stability protein